MVGTHPVLDPLCVAGSVAVDHPKELAPVDGTELPVTRLLVEMQIGVWQREPDLLCLRNGHVHELLT